MKIFLSFDELVSILAKLYVVEVSIETEDFDRKVRILFKQKITSLKPLLLKVQFFCALVKSKKFQSFIEWFYLLSYDKQGYFFLPKQQLEEGCFALIESYTLKHPEDKVLTPIFVAPGLEGKYLGVECHSSDSLIIKELGRVGMASKSGCCYRLVSVI